MAKTGQSIAATAKILRLAEQLLLEYADAAMPMQTPAHRDYIRKRLPPHMAAHLEREISPSAARQRGDRPGITE